MLKENTFVFNGHPWVLMKIANVSTNTPGNPFSPKSIIHSTAFSERYSRVLANSGVFQQELRKNQCYIISDTHRFIKKKGANVSSIPIDCLLAINVQQSVNGFHFVERRVANDVIVSLVKIVEQKIISDVINGTVLRNIIVFQYQFRYLQTMFINVYHSRMISLPSNFLSIRGIKIAYTNRRFKNPYR